MCGCSSVAEHQLPKMDMRVRFPSPAPKKRQALNACRFLLWNKTELFAILNLKRLLFFSYKPKFLSSFPANACSDRLFSAAILIIILSLKFNIQCCRIPLNALYIKVSAIYCFTPFLILNNNFSSFYSSKVRSRKSNFCPLNVYFQYVQQQMPLVTISLLLHCPNTL